MDVKVFDSADDLTHAVAKRLSHQLQPSAPMNEPRAVMLAGGSTPLTAYRVLAESPFPVNQGAYFLLSDERMVPGDSPDSNFANIAPMLSALGIPQHRIMMVDTEQEPQEAARQYEEELQRFFAVGGRIMLGLLGLGADGHTASLFSAHDLQRAEGRYAIAVQRPDHRAGVSVTPALLARVEELIFVVAGQRKRAILERLFAVSDEVVAAQAVSLHEHVTVWTDQPVRAANRPAL